MLAKQELKSYSGEEKVWLAKYRNPYLRPHWHNDYELLYIASGCAEIVVGGTSYWAEAGQTVFIPGREAHSIQSKPNTVLLSLVFAPELLDSLFSERQFRQPLLRGDYPIETLYQTFKTELQGKRLFYVEITNHLATDLIINMLRSEETCEISGKTTSVHAFRELLQEIDKNYAFYTFEDAAQFMGLNKTYFSALFHKFMGMTFSQYLNQVRIEKAIERLQKDSSAKVTDIAIDCGFYTMRNFNRIFKELTGYSPKQIPATFRLKRKQYFAVDETFNPNADTTVVLECSSTPGGNARTPMVAFS